MDQVSFPIVKNHVQKNLGKPYLRLQISTDKPALIPMSKVQEVLSLPMHRLSPIPNMPSHFLGLMNRGNRVLGLLDLGLLLGVSRLTMKSSHCNVVVIQQESVWIGLAVSQINNMFWLDPSHVQPPSQQSPSQFLHYVLGSLKRDSQELLILDIQKILQAPTLCCCISS